MIVLNDFVEGSALLVVEDDADDSEEDGLKDLEDDIEGLSELVYPVALEDGSKLSAPGGLELFLDVLKFMLNSISFFIHHILLLLVLFYQVVNTLFEQLLHLILVVVLLLLDEG